MAFDVKISAAPYEMALFDPLYEFCAIRGRTFPNIQTRDSDDSVNFQRVMEWINRSADFIEEERLEAMRSWLRDSDYQFSKDSSQD